MRLLLHSARIGLLLLPIGLAAAPGRQLVKIDAGSFDRKNVVVTFPVPKGAPSPLVLTRAANSFPVQVDGNGIATATIDRMAKGETALFEVRPRPNALLDAGQITVQREGKRLNVRRASRTRNGAPPQPLFSYQAEPGDFPRDNIKELFSRGGYIHPIFAPNGKAVTDDFPPNHIHHHGVWWAWTKTEFQGRQPDFWNMGDAKGRVEFESVDEHWSGPVHGGFRARHRFVDTLAQPPVTALTETWTVTAYAAPADTAGSWMFDVVSEQRCATGDPLRLPEYRYGGIGLRGNWAWNGKTNMTFLTSGGETDREKGNATRGRWCDMSGVVEGQHVGIAILDHPSNYRSPQPMRLHPTEPFFNFAPQQAGDMEIKPGEKFTSRYRFIIHDGPPNAAEIDRLWNDFAHPPVVKIIVTGE